MPKKIPESSIHFIVGWFKACLINRQHYDATLNPNEFVINNFCDELKVLLLRHDFDNPDRKCTTAFFKEKEGRALVLETKNFMSEDYYLKTASERANVYQYAFPLMIQIFIFSDGSVVLKDQQQAQLLYAPDKQVETLTTDLARLVI